MEEEWVKIFQTPNELEVEMARQSLDRIGIDSVIINKRDRTYGFGDIELYVHRDNVLQAKLTLKES
jgi:hypothetical protein